MELGNPTSKVNVIYLLLFSLGASTNGFWRVAPDSQYFQRMGTPDVMFPAPPF